MPKPKPAAPPADPRQVETWPLDKIKLNPRNARKHPDVQLERLGKSLKEFGWTNPALVAEDGTLIAGGGRVLAARRIGLTEARVIVVRGWDESQSRAYALTDNRLAEFSEWDSGIVAEELAQLASEFDVGILDFTVVAPKPAAAIAVEEVDTSPVADRFWISVRGPLAQQAHALQQLQSLMAELPGVEVALGTTAIDL